MSMTLRQLLNSMTSTEVKAFNSGLHFAKGVLEAADPRGENRLVDRVAKSLYEGIETAQRVAAEKDAEATATKSYAWYCTDRTSDPKDKWATNAMRFATAEEAKAYGADLRSRWLGMAMGEVRETTDPVNVTWSNGIAVWHD